MDRRIEEEILNELTLVSRRQEERRTAHRIIRLQEILRQHTNDRGWRALLTLESLTGERERRSLLRAIRIAYRRGLCTSRDDLLEQR